MDCVGLGRFGLAVGCCESVMNGGLRFFLMSGMMGWFYGGRWWVVFERVYCFVWC